MKITENISIGGYAFTIETEAYQVLNAYLDDIRQCFNGDSSADEIVADIEERVAELLKERCISGMVVDMQMVQDIMKRIGDPKEMASEEPVSASGTEPAQEQDSEKKNWKARRLYRNIDERVIGGVCSGLGAYFGLDKVLFRIIFLIFLFIGFIGWDDGPYFGFSILAYICLWIAMPAARTVEQKCEMKGKPMNLQGFKSKDFNIEKEAKEVAQSPAGRVFVRAGGVFLGSLLLIIGLGGLLGSIFTTSLPAIIGHEIADEIMDLDAGERMMAEILTGDTFWWLIMVMLGILFVWFLYNGVMLLFDLKAPSWRPGLILFLTWIVSIFVIAAYVIKNVADVLPILMT